jgi:pimeloyl-ACP methyl ester carboxylesterase
VAELRPFTPVVHAEEVADLKARLARTRWPEEATESDWTQGPPLADMRRLVEHWRDGYDWERYAARIASVPQVLVEIDELDVHAVHVRSSDPKAVPLLLTHGWPSTCLEFVDVVPLLTEPGEGQSFHVVCPSLPGYGWSGKPSGTGWGVERTADAWVALMEALGYPKFIAQGGDWGAMVATEIGVRHPDRLLGLHLTMPMATREDGDEADASELQLAGIERENRFRRGGHGYNLLQRTRPQTIGYSLVDSPVGQCAWIVEKLRDWSGVDDDGQSLLTEDEMLDVVSTYWLTGTGASSARLYREAVGLDRGAPVDVPTGVTVFPHEIIRPPRRAVARRYRGLCYWSEKDRGGHFPAAEVPDLFAEEIRAFAEELDLKR